MQTVLTRWSSRIEREQPFCLNCVFLWLYLKKEYWLIRRRPVFRKLIAICCVLFSFCARLRTDVDGRGWDEDSEMRWIELDVRYKKLVSITSWSSFYKRKRTSLLWSLKQLLSLILFWWRSLFEPCPAVVKRANPKRDRRLISTHALCLRRRMTQRDSLSMSFTKFELFRIGPIFQWLCGLLIASAIWLLFFWLPTLARKKWTWISHCKKCRSPS